MKLPISRFTVHGNSMTPTLRQGQDVLSINWFINPKVGDIVIVKGEIIKRVIRIVEDKLWLEGDNKTESTDSRDFGAVDRKQVIGKVIHSSGQIPCPRCESPVIGIYGRKDAVCNNCGFKLTCCE